MPLTSPGNDDDTGENHQPTLRKNTAEPVEQTLKQNSSGAYGIPQALPASKLASAGDDWKDDAATQIKWGLNYIAGRYGSPSAAKTFWLAHNWY